MSGGVAAPAAHAASVTAGPTPTADPTTPTNPAVPALVAASSPLPTATAPTAPTGTPPNQPENVPPNQATQSAALPETQAASAPLPLDPAVVAQTSAPGRASPVESTVDSVAGLLPGRVPSRAAPVSAPIEVPEHARSTAAQRRAMRTKLGARYDVATRAVTKLLSERPGLRFGAGDRAAILAELAVVRVFADDPGGQYDADFYVCLADGLRRLPTARTVVVRGIPVDTEVRPESVIRLPTPVVAAPVAGAGVVGPAEALIWTTTGRRLDGLLDDEPPADDEDEETPPVQGRSSDVVLSGHTRLRVLAVESTPVRRILLAEDGAVPEAALTRLRAAAAARPEVGAVVSGRWFGSLPAAG